MRTRAHPDKGVRRLTSSTLATVAVLPAVLAAQELDWDPSVPEHLYSESKEMAQQYIASPLRNSAEANRLLTEGILPHVWLDGVLDVDDTRLPAEVYSGAAEDIAERWAAVNRQHRYDHMGRRTLITTARIASSSTGVAPPVAASLQAGAEGAYWDDVAKKAIGAQVEVGLIRRGLDELDQQMEEVQWTPQTLEQRVTVLLDRENGPFKDVPSTVYDALQDRALKYTVDTIKELDTAVQYNARSINELAEDFVRLQEQFDQLQEGGNEAAATGRRIARDLDRATAKLERQNDSGRSISAEALESETKITNAVIEYAQTFQRSAQVAGQLVELGTALKLDTETIKAMQRGQAVLQAAAVGARLYSGDPTAAMQVLPALTGLAGAFGGSGKSEAQLLAEQILAAIQKLSEQIQKNHEEVVEKLDRIESITLHNQQLLVHIIEDDVVGCTDFFPGDWFEGAFNEQTGERSPTKVLNPKLPLRFQNYASIRDRSGAAGLEGCLGVREGGLVSHFRKAVLSSPTMPLFTHQQTDYLRKGPDGQILADEFTPSMLTVETANSVKSDLLKLFRKNGVFSQQHRDLLVTPASSFDDLVEKLEAINEPVPMAIESSPTRPDYFIDDTAHMRRNFEFVTDPSRVRTYTSYAVALQPIYDFYSSNGTASGLLSRKELLSTDTVTNTTGHRLMYRARALLTQTIAQETLYQGDIALPVFYAMATNQSTAPAESYIDDIAVQSDGSWKKGNVADQRKQVAELRETLASAIERSSLLAYNLMIYGFKRDLRPEHMELYRQALAIQENNPAPFLAILPNWNITYRAQKYTEEMLYRALRTAIASDAPDLSFDEEQFEQEVRRVFFSDSRLGGIITDSDQLSLLSSVVRQFGSKEIAALASSEAYEASEAQSQLATFARLFAEEIVAARTVPSGWSVDLLGNQYRVPGHNAVQSGLFELAYNLDDLLLLRERTVDAISSYEVINWAKEDEERAVAMKRHFVESTVLQ